MMTVVTERLKCNPCFQQDGKSMGILAVELKRLALTCAFATLLDDALTARPMAEFHDRTTQAKLLNKRKLIPLSDGTLNDI